MKNVKITTIILAIILITMIAFGGVYVKTQNRMENKVKELTIGRELKGGRVVELKATTGDKETNTENLTEENYEIVKKTIEKRLNNLQVQDYTISLNKQDGTIRVELTEDYNTDTYIYFLTASGKVQIKEKDADTELLSDSMVESAEYTYEMTTHNPEIGNSYQVYLILHLTEEGQTKFAEIQNNYAVFANEIKEIEEAQEAEKNKAEEGKEVKEGEETTTEEVSTESSENTSESAAETKKIAVLTIAGTEYDIEKVEKNKIKVQIGGETTNTVSINNNMSAAAELALLIDSGKLPVEYEIEDNRFVESDITENQVLYFAIFIAIILLVVFVIITIKYKTKGLLASISFIGFISILSLILRYTNVNISIEGIGAILLVVIINFRINQLILEKTKTMNLLNEAVISTYKEVFLKLVPIIIISLVFSFAGWANLSSFGMIMFWGLLLIVIYNTIVTKTLLKLKESK